MSEWGRVPAAPDDRGRALSEAFGALGLRGQFTLLAPLLLPVLPWWKASPWRYQPLVVDGVPEFALPVTPRFGLTGGVP
jgi:hypothetical protein